MSAESGRVKGGAGGEDVAAILESTAVLGCIDGEAKTLKVGTHVYSGILLNRRTDTLIIVLVEAAIDAPSIIVIGRDVVSQTKNTLEVGGIAVGEVEVREGPVEPRSLTTAGVAVMVVASPWRQLADRRGNIM